MKNRIIISLLVAVFTIGVMGIVVLINNSSNYIEVERLKEKQKKEQLKRLADCLELKYHFKKVGLQWEDKNTGERFSISNYGDCAS